MARRRTNPPTEDLPPVEETIVDVDVEQEMQGAFLEYAYSVIYSRALPDARDGLKPVQRRILFGMHELGLRPDRGHVKSSRIVGEVMGKYHPHGDSAIYDALVRLAQPFTMRLPLVDGHGNFGSLDDGPAASRYTEARMAAAALPMVQALEENTVDFVPNYDDQLEQPGVLPAAFPNLLVNGASGIAVGMATNMPPHNLVEVVNAARHLIDHPEATLDDLMRFVPGPDLPGGGRITSLEGIREAYATGRGSFKTRATARIENVTPRRKGIVVTELPYLVGPEKVRDKLAALVRARRVQGISDFKDLSDRKSGLRIVIEVKNGFNPEAVLEQLYRLTPLEDSFGINNVALVNGQPQTLGLRDLLLVYVDFRIEVVRRRSAHRLGQREGRLHLVDGLLLALVDIDEVIQVIRSSDDADTARTRLMEVFDLSELQASYILELRLRRLTKFSRIELEGEREQLTADIEQLRAILADDVLLRRLVSDELTEVAKAHGTPRRTVLLESAGAPLSTGPPLEVADDPCWVLLSSAGLLARTSDAVAPPSQGPRSQHDAIVSLTTATARGDVGLVTSAGRVLRLSVVELPTLPPTHAAPALSGGTPLTAFVDLAPEETVLGLVSLEEGAPGLAMGTRDGVVKRVVAEHPGGRREWEIITLKEGDRLVGAVELRTGSEELVFVTSDAQLLHFPASAVRPQGRPAGGMAGVKLGSGARVLFFGAVDADRPAAVVTASGSAAALPGTEAGSVKVTGFEEYPGKGRGTGGVRCHRFLRGEDTLVIGWAGNWPARAAAANGVPVPLPEPTGRRDGSGSPGSVPIAGIAPARPEPAFGRDAARADGASDAVAADATVDHPSGGGSVPDDAPTEPEQGPRGEPSDQTLQNSVDAANDDPDASDAAPEPTLFDTD